MVDKSLNPVLVTGDTCFGRLVVAELLAAGVPVRALTRRRQRQVAGGRRGLRRRSPAPDTLDTAMLGAGALFLLWTAPPATVGAVVERLAAHTQRVVFLSSPHQTPHPFFQQPNPMATLHAGIERAIAAAGLAATMIRPGMFASNVTFWWADAIRNGGVVRWPYGAAETAPIDERDVAAVAARALYRDGHAGGDATSDGPRVIEPGRAGQHHCGHDRALDPIRGAYAGRVSSRD